MSARNGVASTVEAPEEPRTLLALICRINGTEDSAAYHEHQARLGGDLAQFHATHAEQYRAKTEALLSRLAAELGQRGITQPIIAGQEIVRLVDGRIIREMGVYAHDVRLQPEEDPVPSDQHPVIDTGELMMAAMASAFGEPIDPQD